MKKAAPVTAAIPVSATPSTVVAPAASAASSSDSKTADDGNFFSNMMYALFSIILGSQCVVSRSLIVRD